MIQQQAKNIVNDFTTGPVLRAMLSFSFPLFLSNLLQAVYNVVDMIVVGHVVGEAGLSGITVGGDVLSFLTFLAMGVSDAGQIIIAQYLGAGWRDRISRFIGTMFSFLMLCAVGMSIVCLLLRNQILSWLNTPSEAWDQAIVYATTCMFGLVFIYGYNIIGAVLRGLGDSKRPFLFISVAAILNLVLDLVFVAGLGWESFGAALATVIAQGFSFLSALLYLYMRRTELGFTFALKMFRMDSHELMPLIKLGIPMAFRSVAIHFSKLFVSAWVNSYGVTISAVAGIGHKVELFGNLMGTAVTTAGCSMVGQNIGARKYNRVSRILRAAFLLNGICFSVVFAAVFFFPQTIFGLFTHDSGVLLVCMEYVPVALIYFVSSALRLSMNAFTGGCGNYKFNLCVAILDGIVARIGFSLLLGVILNLGYYGFWMGNAISGSVPFFLGAVYYLSGGWRQKSNILTDVK